VDDAADAAVEADIGEAAVGGAGLARILLRLVAQLRDVRAAEERVVVEAHLGVEGEQLALSGEDERVDLDHGGVELAEGAVAAEQGLHGLRHLPGLEAEGERELARLEGLHADRRVDGEADQGLRPVAADVLDLHAAGGGGNDHHALALPVEHEAEIELARDLCGSLDIEAVDDPAPRAPLVRDPAPAQQLVGGGPHLVLVAAELDAAGLAAAAGMHLRLHDPALAADLAGAIGGLLRAIGEAAARHGHTELREQLLGLVFVDVHESFLRFPAVLTLALSDQRGETLSMQPRWAPLPQRKRARMTG